MGKNLPQFVGQRGTLDYPPYFEGQVGWGNTKMPDVYIGKADQEYPYSTIFRNGMRTFVYTQMDGTYFGEEVGGENLAIGAGYLSETSAEYVNLLNAVITGAAGSTEVRITRDATTANQFAGGFIGIKHSTSGRQTVGRYSYYQILANTADDASDIVTFQLDGKIVLALTTTTDVVLSAHPYKVTRHLQSGPFGMATGVFTHTTVASEWCWLQTGGPCNLVLPWGTHEGTTGGSVPVYNIGGVAQQTTAINASTVYTNMEAPAYQCIGWSYPSTDTSSGPGNATGTDNNIAIAVFLKIIN